MVNIRLTYGALVSGSLIAMFLSGIVSSQVFQYYRTYPEDCPRNKIVVAAVWALDLVHAVFVFVTVFRYVTSGLVDVTAITHIAWTVSVAIAITGVLTFIVHCFFIMRVWTLSKHNKWLCVTIFVLAFARMISAFGAIIEIFRYETWKAFHAGAAWIFTTGLIISVAVDIMIVFSLLWYLNRSRTGFHSMDQIIDTIMANTIENGLLTTIVTIASFVTWRVMSHNIIFLAFHFCISQLYANSLLATLNARARMREKALSTSREQSHSGYRLPTILSNRSKHTDQDEQTTQTDSPTQSNNKHRSSQVRISIAKSVHRDRVTETMDSTKENEDVEYIERTSQDLGVP